MNRPIVEVHLGAGDLRAGLIRDVADGLGSRPYQLPPKWFYDERGCQLFEEITRLAEYYPTRTEREILADRAGEMAALAAADTLVELGSGTSEKTRLLLDAMAGSGTLRRIVAFDVSEPTIRSATAALAVEYPGAEVRGVVGDFDHHLGRLPAGGRRLFAFLGSTIGNLGPPDRKRFLAELVDGFEPDDCLLLGTDLEKDPARLVAAYDDAGGVTAAFNANVLAVVNRELGADFELADFEHVARWEPADAWMAMSLRARRPHSVRVTDLDLGVEFTDGDEVHTEISAKFRRDVVEAELAGAGLEPLAWWTDRAGDFAVSLARA